LLEDVQIVDPTSGTPVTPLRSSRPTSPRAEETCDAVLQIESIANAKKLAALLAAN
jgi:hypothetical protein